MKPLVAKTLDVARRELGVREQGQANWGPRVSEYLRSIGLNFPAPWCAAFTFYCTDEAAKTLGCPNPFPRLGYCPSIASWADGHDCLEEEPEVGDAFLVYTHRARHIGFVEQVRGSQIVTIEGNTNLGGSPEGIGVFRRTRTNGSRLKFVRWGKLAGYAPGELQPRPWRLFIGGQERWSLTNLGGRTYSPVRKWAELMGFRLDWNADDQSVLFNGREVELDIVLQDGLAYAPLRQLVASAGLRIEKVENGAVYVGRAR